MISKVLNWRKRMIKDHKRKKTIINNLCDEVHTLRWKLDVKGKSIRRRELELDGLVGTLNKMSERLEKSTDMTSVQEKKIRDLISELDRTHKIIKKLQEQVPLCD